MKFPPIKNWNLKKHITQRNVFLSHNIQFNKSINSIHFIQHLQIFSSFPSSFQKSLARHRLWIYIRVPFSPNVGLLLRLYNTSSNPYHLYWSERCFCSLPLHFFLYRRKASEKESIKLMAIGCFYRQKDCYYYQRKRLKVENTKKVSEGTDSWFDKLKIAPGTASLAVGCS